MPSNTLKYKGIRILRYKRTFLLNMDARALAALIFKLVYAQS